MKVLSVTEPNIDGPMGTLFDSMNDGMNQLYSEELSVKVKRGQNENVINGKSLGGYRPIGYNIVDGRFVIDEKEGPIVQEVFDLYGRAGLSMLSIAKKLEAEGKRKNDGRPLVHNHLEKIISNEKYIGVLKCQVKGTTTPSRLWSAKSCLTYAKAEERRGSTRTSECEERRNTT